MKTNVNVKKKLPLYQLKVNDKDEFEGIEGIALVSDPAIEVGFLAFANQKECKFEIQDQDKQILFGPVLIPGKPIFRKDYNDDGDADVFFSADDVEKIVQKFFRQGNEQNVNLEHALQVSGATLYQAFISDKANGINPSQFADLPDKTFFVAYKVYDDILWTSIKEGLFKGFSLEGFFDSLLVKHSKQNTDETLLMKLEEILSSEIDDIQKIDQFERLLKEIE